MVLFLKVPFIDFRLFMGQGMGLSPVVTWNVKHLKKYFPWDCNSLMYM